MKLRNKRGQAMAEYIIIVVVVALAALAIVGLFGDTIRTKFGGAVEQMGGDTSGVGQGQSSKSFFQNLKDSNSNN